MLKFADLGIPRFCAFLAEAGPDLRNWIEMTTLDPTSYVYT